MFEKFARFLYTMNADGSDVVRLTKNLTQDKTPAWSPDGRRIIFESNSEIMAINVDGSSVANLTKNPADDFEPTCACFNQ